MQVIYNIPVLGGFCAPTEHPEPSCTRHFSNEYTLPGAQVFMKVACLVETNALLRGCGRLGSQRVEKQRRPLMLMAFAVSTLAFVLTIYAALGVSWDATILSGAAWVYGSLQHSQTGASIWIAVGLSSRLDHIDCTTSNDLVSCREVMQRANFHEIRTGVFERVVSWSDNQSCTSLMRTENDTAIGQSWEFLTEGAFTEEICTDCRSSATASILTALGSVLSMVPQMTTDLQRMTRFGDMNCQKTMGTVTSFFGFFSGLVSLWSFSTGCWSNLPEKARWVDREKLGWRTGPAFICFGVACVLKLWDGFTHLLVPTPKGRHTPPPPGSSLAVYMGLGITDSSEVKEKKDEGEHGEGAQTIGREFE